MIDAAPRSPPSRGRYAHQARLRRSGRGQRMIRRLTNPADRWLLNSHPWSRGSVGLFCFAYAGGGASLFRDWVGALGGSVDVCPVQLPGREGRFHEPAFTRLTPLLDSLVQSLGPQLQRPFALFGHSLGALIAFEFAR